MESKAKIKRDLILKSAIEYILDNEFDSLTLDAIAKQAGISKGGLLYHFPSKEALFLGLAQQIFEEFIHHFDECAKNDSEVNGKWSRALIEASIWDLKNNNGKLNIGIIAASTLNPELAKSISTTYQSVIGKVEQDGINLVTATIIRLAIDGLYYSELFNIAPINEDLRKDVIKQLVDMTK